MDEIKKIRVKIDKIDDKLFKLFLERVELVKQVGEIKNRQQIAIQDKKREREIIRKKVRQAEKIGLNPKFVRRVWRIMFKEAYKLEAQ